MERNIPLDSYRGILALLVALGHYFYWLGDGEKYPISFILSVDFFFILSGYVLSVPILLSKSSDFNYFCQNFVKNRFFRIFPLYLFLVIPLSIAAFGLSEKLPNAMDWLSILGLLHIFPLPLNSGFNIPLGISWSISAEFWIGILYFSILFLFRRSVFLYVVLTVISIFLLIILSKYSPFFMDVHEHQLNDFITFAMIRALLGFCLGSLVAYVSLNSREGGYALHSIFQCLLLFLVFILYAKNNHDRQNEYVAPILFSFFIYSISIKKGVLYTLLNNNVAHYVGKISYSIYLSHPVVIAFFKQGLFQKNIMIYLVLVLVLSGLLYFVIEKPFIQYGKKIKLGKYEES